MRRVYVTGLGAVSSIGFGRQAFQAALEAGRSGASEVSLFDTTTMDRHVACEVRDFRARDFLTAAEARRTGKCGAMTLAAARMAVEDAGLRPDQLKGDRTAVIVGTTMGEANVLGELEAAWIHNGAEAIRTARIP